MKKILSINLSEQLIKTPVEVGFIVGSEKDEKSGKSGNENKNKKNYNSKT